MQALSSDPYAQTSGLGWMAPTSTDIQRSQDFAANMAAAQQGRAMMQWRDAGQPVFNPGVLPQLTQQAQQAQLASAGQDQQDAIARTAYGRDQHPLVNGLSTQDTLAAQLAGDQRGDVKQVLQSLQGLNPMRVGSNQGLHPYLPSAGFGGAPDTENFRDKLDHDLLNDPILNKLMVKDPHRGQFVYRQLTGREYTDDLKGHDDILKAKRKIGMDYTVDAIKRGAKFNPDNGKWTVPNLAEETDPTTGQKKTTIQLSEATPEQAAWLNENYGYATGHNLPSLTPQDRLFKSKQASREEVMGASQTAAFQDKLTRFTQQQGRPATPLERARLWSATVQSTPQDATLAEGGNWGRATANFFADLGSRATSGIAGINPDRQAISSGPLRFFNPQTQPSTAQGLVGLARGLSTNASVLPPQTNPLGTGGRIMRVAPSPQAQTNPFILQQLQNLDPSLPADIGAALNGLAQR